MSVTAQTSFVEYVGNGTTSTGYTITFEYQDAADIAVYVDAVAYTNFSIAGGKVYTGTAIAGSSEVRIENAVPYSQTLELVQDGDFSSALSERAWDRAVLMIQQLRDAIGRCLRMKRGATPAEMAEATDVYAYIDASGNLVSRTAAQVAADVSPELDATTGDKVTRTCADAAARAALVPDFTGQLLIQLDTGVLYRSTGVSAGNWTISSGGAPEGTAVLSTGETLGKVLRADGDDTCSWVAFAGGGDALVANPLSQFAATTSAQLRGVLSDETGTGAAVFADGPNLGAVTTITHASVSGTNQELFRLATASGGGLSFFVNDLSSANPIWKIRPNSNEGLAIMRGGQSSLVNAYFHPDGILVLGDAVTFSSTDPEIVVSGTKSPAANSHQFVAEQDVTAANNTGHNGFDWRSTYTGTNLDHIAGFQSLASLNHSGTTTNAWGFYHRLDVDAGTVTNATGVHIIDSTGVGTVTNQRGIKIDTLTKGATTNYAISIGSTDADQNLIHVGVTGNPILSWDESEDRFATTKGIHVGGAVRTDGAIELGDATDTTITRSSAGIVAVEGAPLAFVQRYRNFYVDAKAMVSRTTNGAAAATEEYATNDVMSDHFLFDATTEEGVQFRMAMPDDWDLGTIKAKFFWDVASGGTGTGVTWGIAAAAKSNDDAIDAAFSASVDTDDTVIAVGDVHVTAASASVTVGGTPALGDLIWFEITRVVGDANDDRTADAKLLGVQIQYRTLTTEPAAW